MIKKSLSFRILFYFSLISLSTLILSYFVFENITKESFYMAEKEKAEIIADTIKPLIEIELFLGFDANIKNIVKEVSKNRNIISIQIVKNGKILENYNKMENINSLNSAILVSRELTEPKSKKILGRLEILYSSEHYKNLIKKYQKSLILFILGLGFLFLLYGYYLNMLIKPLKEMAKYLNSYNPKNRIKLDSANREDEIGAIAKAINKMQNKIYEFTKKQENINRLLEKKVQEKTKELKDMLYIDSLTGLPNRFNLLEEIKIKKNGSLLIINIDDFKEINDYFGHKTGDKILKGFANRLRNLIKTEYPKIFRLSGDEFALFFNKKMTNHDLSHFIELLLKSIEKMTFFHQDNELNIRVTIGATNNMDTPLEKADIALKIARKYRLPFKIYNDSLRIETQYKENIEWVKRIKKALDKDKIVPYFQPIYDLNRDEIKGYEALVRLIGENDEIVSPYKFLDIAKRSRYYSQITKTIFEKSCKYFKNTDCEFSFNLSIEDILDEEIVEYLSETVKSNNMQNRITFEITESEGIENYEEILDFIKCMKKMGIKFAVDDFGSGYSNFEYLAKLDIDYIKIDGSLIKNIDNDHNSLIVVETIADYAKKRGLKTIAEYVSSREIYEIVKDLNIDFAQGYYLSKPKKFDMNLCQYMIL